MQNKHLNISCLISLKQFNYFLHNTISLSHFPYYKQIVVEPSLIAFIDRVILLLLEQRRDQGKLKLFITTTIM